MVYVEVQMESHELYIIGMLGQLQDLVELTLIIQVKFVTQLMQVHLCAVIQHIIQQLQLLAH